MALVTKPPVLDESVNTTESPSRNIADVLAQELSGIASAITGGSDKVPKTDVATVEPTNTASRAYSVGELVYVNGNLYKVITAISIGSTFTVGTNIQSTNVSDGIKTVNKSAEIVSTGAEVSTNCRFVYTERKWGNVIWVHVEIAVNTSAGAGSSDTVTLNNLVNVPPTVVTAISSNDYSSSDYTPCAIGSLFNNKALILKGKKTVGRGGSMDFIYLV